MSQNTETLVGIAFLLGALFGTFVTLMVTAALGQIAL